MHLEGLDLELLEVEERKESNQGQSRFFPFPPVQGHRHPHLHHGLQLNSQRAVKVRSLSLGSVRNEPGAVRNEPELSGLLIEIH